MEQVIREVTGDEAKLLALQFLGQNIGEMKEFDKNIVSSLKPMYNAIDPNSIVKSIPGIGQQQPAPVQQPVAAPQPVMQAQPVSAPGPVVIPSLASLQTPVPQSAPVETDPNQLELNFNASPYSEQIFNKLEALEKKINSFLETQQHIIDSIEDIKKKADGIPVAV